MLETNETIRLNNNAQPQPSTLKPATNSDAQKTISTLITSRKKTKRNKGYRYSKHNQNGLYKSV